MSDFVIKVENLSKCYMIRHQNGTGDGIRHVIQDFATAPLRWLRRQHGTWSNRHVGDNNKNGVGFSAQGSPLPAPNSLSPTEEFWALKDVSFEVKRGEVVGIIGRNGAGKSTLLKILSRITEPTEGRIRIKGRVASLLEVGTGFHPELTGRENIFLNGAILGMTKQEIKVKFDEIVNFAEIDMFLDTPVKRYSSGMYVRLAFAVAAHLEPEILIVDEVLAVGDAVFQKKCLGKMSQVAHAGRTVLFVSHNLPAIVSLTDRALLLERGQLVNEGPSGDVVASYLRGEDDVSKDVRDLSPFRRHNRTDGYVEFASIKVCGHKLGCAIIDLGSPILIDLELHVLREIQGGHISIDILNDKMETVTSIFSTDNSFNLSLTVGYRLIRCSLGVLPLAPGKYYLNVGINQSFSTLSWDVLHGLPGFRILGMRSPIWLTWPNRGGSLFIEHCEWSYSY